MQRSLRLSNLKAKVMNRVYGAWFLRNTMPLLVIEVIILAVAVGFFAQFVFVEEVVSNTLNVSLGNPFKMIGYLTGAFFVASASTKAAIIAVALGLLMFLRDINKSLISYAAMKRSQINA